MIVSEPLEQGNFMLDIMRGILHIHIHLFDTELPWFTASLFYRGRRKWRFGYNRAETMANRGKNFFNKVIIEPVYP